MLSGVQVTIESKDAAAGEYMVELDLALDFALQDQNSENFELHPSFANNGAFDFQVHTHTHNIYIIR